MSKNIVCACPFCNQIIDPQGNKITSTESAEQIATSLCNCREAIAMNTATKIIEEMFNGEPGVNDKTGICKLINHLAKAIIDNLLEKISIQISKTTAVTLAASKKNTLSIKLTHKETQTREI